VRGAGVDCLSRESVLVFQFLLGSPGLVLFSSSTTPSTAIFSGNKLVDDIDGGGGGACTSSRCLSGLFDEKAPATISPHEGSLADAVSARQQVPTVLSQTFQQSTRDIPHYIISVLPLALQILLAGSAAITPGVRKQRWIHCRRRILGSRGYGVRGSARAGETRTGTEDIGWITAAVIVYRPVSPRCTRFKLRPGDGF